jgi:hypothetical protein
MILASGMSALEWAQFAALAAAALFFLAKRWSGYFVVDLTLDATLTRQQLSDTDDAIVVLATIGKGKAGSIFIEELAAHYEDRGTSHVTAFVSVDRLEWAPQDPRLSETPEAWTRLAGRPLRLPVDETMSASCWFPVTPGSVCTVEVVAIGRSWQYRHPPQWRTSRVSLPIPDASD